VERKKGGGLFLLKFCHRAHSEGLAPSQEGVGGKEKGLEELLCQFCPKTYWEKLAKTPEWERYSETLG
jgi:hypothetical protein